VEESIFTVLFASAIEIVMRMIVGFDLQEAVP
jgi:hypothetical protein